MVFVELTAGAGHGGIKEDRTVTCFDYYSMECLGQYTLRYICSN